MGVREEDVEFEEELYTAGNVVVWSQGSRLQASSVYKAFTVDSPVQQVCYQTASYRNAIVDRVTVLHSFGNILQLFPLPHS